MDLWGDRFGHVPRNIPEFIDLCLYVVGNSAKTPVPATRNSAASYGIAALIGVTDVRVQ